MSVTFSPPADPSNTFRAKNTVEMYDIMWTTPFSSLSYEVGVVPAFKTSIYFRNRTVNLSLSVTIQMPPYLMLEQSYNSITLDPTRIHIFDIKFNDNVMKNHVKTNISAIQSAITYNVTPLNVTGPVFIQTDLPQLTVI